MQYKTLTLTPPDDSGSFTGTAWAYEVDRAGDIITPGAFNDAIRKFHAGHSIPLLWNHSQSEPIGALTGLQDTADGLLVSGQLTLGIPRADEVYALLKQNALSLSIGFQHAATDTGTDGRHRVITRVDLLEVSLVAVPCNAGAQIRNVKTFADVNNARDFEALVRDALGLSRRQAKTLTAAGYPALTQRDAEVIGDDARKAILGVLHKRAERIQKVMRGY